MKVAVAKTDRPTSDNESAILRRYGQRSAEFAQRATGFSRRLDSLLIARYVLAGVASLALLCVVTGLGPTRAAIGAIAIFTFGWLACTVLGESWAASLRYTDCLRKINDESIARIERRWDAIPLVSPELPPATPALAGDLDLLGKASLFHLVCQAQTPWGIGTLRDWMLAAGCPPNLAERQRAAGELAGELEFRQAFAAHGRLVGGQAVSQAAFARWAEKGLPAVSGRIIEVCRIALPAMVVVLVGLFATGIMPADAFGSALIVLLLTNFLLTTFLVGEIHDLVLGVLSAGLSVDQSSSLFALLVRAIERYPHTAPFLGQASAAVADSCAALARLKRIAFFAPGTVAVGLAAGPTAHAVGFSRLSLHRALAPAIRGPAARVARRVGPVRSGPVAGRAGPRQPDLDLSANHSRWRGDLRGRAACPSATALGPPRG